MTNAERFGANLARARRQADMTQDELAVRAAIHRTELSELERGLRLPLLVTAIKLADSLEVRLNELVEGIAWTPGEVRHGGFREGER